MNYIITKDKSFFEKISPFYFYCDLDDMILPDKIAVDTETTSLSPLDGDIFAIQIGTGKDNYLIDLQVNNDGYTVEEVIPYLKGKTLVGHNFTFDLKFFYKHGFYPDQVEDTMIQSMLLYNGKSKSKYLNDFGSVMEREIGKKYDKTQQKNIHIVKLSNEHAIQYCFNDVDKLLKLNDALNLKIKADGMEGTYFLHRHFVRVLAYMENCGLPINVDKWKHKMELDFKNMLKAKQDVVDYVYDHLPRWRSHQEDLFSNEKKILVSTTSPKMLEIFKDFGINVEDHNKKSKESLDKKVLQKSKHPFIDLWFTYQGYQHRVTTYGKNILRKVRNGRVYTNFRPLVDTARLATRKGGINFLNFEADKETRDCFEALPGRKMIVCDYDGQENTTGADLHKDPMMVKSLTEGADLHCAFARLIFPEISELTDDQIKEEHKDKRTYAKSPRFAFAYGGTGHTLVRNLSITEEEGMRLEMLYKELHSGIYEWGDKIFDEVVKQGYIKSAGGFRLYLPHFDIYEKNLRTRKSYTRGEWNVYGMGKTVYKYFTDVKKIQKFKFGHSESRYIKEHMLPAINAVDEKTLPKPVKMVIDQGESILKKVLKKYLVMLEVLKNINAAENNFYKLCLNNPVQTTSAHQTKLAMILLFDKIRANGDIDKVLICNMPHDEIVLETITEELAHKYAPILEESMKEGANRFLKSGLVSMSCAAAIGQSWYEAK